MTMMNNKIVSKKQKNWD